MKAEQSAEGALPPGIWVRPCHRCGQPVEGGTSGAYWHQKPGDAYQCMLAYFDTLHEHSGEVRG